jgi:Mg2+ and Co2+ transporter CorA
MLSVLEPTQDAATSPTESNRTPARSRSGELRAHLFDANGRDRNVDIEPGIHQALEDHHLLWVDLTKPDASDIDEMADALDLPNQLREELHSDGDGVHLHRYVDCIHLVVEVLEDADDGATQPQQLELIAGRGYVVTIANSPLSPVANFVDAMRGDTRLGGLGSAGFVAAIVDSVLNSYLHQVEQVERQVDELDLMALDSDINDGFLPQVVELRKRIARIRRTLVRHRAAFAPLARPDFALHEELGEPWPGLVDRLERTIDAVENTRDLLVGSLEIYLGQVGQRTNEVMKLLTLLSAVLLPAVVVAGVMGMNFQMGFFDTAENFWIVVGVMLALGASALVIAKLQKWI